jgi:hypothetical protein
MREPSTWLWVALIGLGVGMVELVARYRDNPLRALRTFSALSYVILNVVACVVCLAVLDIVRPSWIFDDKGLLDDKGRLYLILAAGFGAVAIFRSSIFKLKTPDGDFAVGPSIILDTLLSASDRGVDRQIAAPRGEIVSRIMKGVTFDRAKAALPAYCFALMQNVGPQEQKAFSDQVNSLSATPMADQVRALNLGLALINLVGTRVLERAVADLKPLITADPPVAERDVAKTADLMADVDFEKARLVLPIYCFSIAGSVSADTQKGLADQIQAISAASLPPRVRALTLGLSLSQLVGFDVLKFCVDELGNDIRSPPP